MLPRFSRNDVIPKTHDVFCEKKQKVITTLVYNVRIFWRNFEYLVKIAQIFENLNCIFIPIWVVLFFFEILIYLFFMLNRLWNFQPICWTFFVSSSSSSSWPRLSLEGRRSQGGFNLNSLVFGVFVAPKYIVFLSEVFSCVSRSSKKSFAF